MRVLDAPFHADSDPVSHSAANSAPSLTLNKYKLKGYVTITATCGSTAAQRSHKSQKIILKWCVKKQGRLLGGLDSSGCAGYVAYQLQATMHTLTNFGVPQHAGNSLNSCRAISISWTAKLRAGTCHPTQQALCFMTCINAPRNTQNNKSQQNTILEPDHAQISLRFSLSYKRDQPIFYYCRFRSDACASVTQFRTGPLKSFFVNFVTA